MRHAIPLILLVALAGCTQSVETPTPTPVSTPSEGAPVEFTDVDIDHEFEATEESVPFEIPRGAGQLQVSVYFTTAVAVEGQAVCAPQAEELRIVVTSPGGEEVSSTTMSGAGGISVGGGGDVCGSQDHKDTPLAPGTWTATFSGSGRGIVGHVHVARSG